MKGRILGIDPGLQSTGFGVVEVDGRGLAYVASGTIRTKEAAQSDLPGRLKIIFEGVREVIATYAPDCASPASASPHAGWLAREARNGWSRGVNRSCRDGIARACAAPAR